MPKSFSRQNTKHFSVSSYIFRTYSCFWGTVYFNTSLYKKEYIIVRQCLFDSYQIPVSILLLFTPPSQLGQSDILNKQWCEAAGAYKSWDDPGKETRVSGKKVQKKSDCMWIPLGDFVLCGDTWGRWIHSLFLISIPMWASHRHTSHPSVTYLLVYMHHWSHCKIIDYDHMLNCFYVLAATAHWVRLWYGRAFKNKAGLNKVRQPVLTSFHMLHCCLYKIA